MVKDSTCRSVAWLMRATYPILDKTASSILSKLAVGSAIPRILRRHRTTGGEDTISEIDPHRLWEHLLERLQSD